MTPSLAQRLAAATAFADDAPAIARMAAAHGEEVGLTYARLRAAIHLGRVDDAFAECDRLLELLPKERGW